MILETAYLPPVSWLREACRREVLVIEACEHFQKGSWRNRCLIVGPNGPQRLSIPLVKGKHQQTPIKEVQIAYTERWQQVHWRSICTAYGNAPFFEFYADLLEPFYTRQYQFLFDYNLQLTELLLQKLGWKGRIECSDNFTANKSAPDTHQLPVYPQVFQERHGFIADASGLDLLMCCGKQGASLLAT